MLEPYVDFGGKDKAQDKVLRIYHCQNYEGDGPGGLKFGNFKSLCAVQSIVVL